MAVKDIKLTNTGDIALDTLCRPTWLRGKPAVEQIVRATISMWKGNWFRDRTRGMDWLGVLRFDYNVKEIISLVKQALMRSVYVTDVVDVTVDVDIKTRIAKLNYTCKSREGIVTGSEEL